MAKILLVEDEVNIASFIERGLQEFGHEVSVAYDGMAGWELLQKENFQFLILDIIMPRMNGVAIVPPIPPVVRIPVACDYVDGVGYDRRYC